MDFLTQQDSAQQAPQQGMPQSFAQQAPQQGMPQSFAQQAPQQGMPQNFGQQMSYQVPSQPMSQQAPMQPKKKKKPFLVIGIILAVIILGVAVGVFIFVNNTPEKRFERNMEQGEKYLDEEEFEEALAAYQAAIEIDPKAMDAYLDAIDAYLELEDEEGLQSFYEEAIKAIETLDEDELEDYMDEVVEIYTMVDEVYPDDTQEVISILDDGYDLTDKNEDVEHALTNAYADLADEYHNDGEHTKELETYDKLLKVDPDNSKALTNRSGCLIECLDILMAEENYDEAESLIAKYSDVVTDVDFNYYLTRIQTIREQTEMRELVLTNTYEYMRSGDFEAMAELDGAEDTNAVVETFNGEPCIITADGVVTDYTGTAAGIYPFGEGGYYFYYGDYVDGQREGYGIYFISGDNYYRVFDGNWENDKPNGMGAVLEYYRQGEWDTYGGYYIKTMSGNFKDGLFNGIVNATIEDNYNTGLVYTCSFMVQDGLVSDIWEQYPQYHDDYYELTALHEEGNIIYAIYENPTVDYLWWSYFSSADSKLGLSGFTE